jgi:dienelactone hydrolase
MISKEATVEAVRVPADSVRLEGELIVPAGAPGIVIFAHGSGSSRHSPRNKFVAQVIRNAGIGTLLFDLLTPEEESVDIYTRHLRFDIEMLAGRLSAVAKWLNSREGTSRHSLGFFGASTGGGAALVAAAELGEMIAAVVSRGGRPDLAGDALPYVRCPVLLIVGGLDEVVIGLNQQAYDRLNCEKELKIIPGATHLFEEPGTLEAAAHEATSWFAQKFQGERRTQGIVPG